MSYNFDALKKNISSVEEWLKSEYGAVRTGRATPVILDKVMVDSYGSKMPVKNMANISVEDARTLRVVPWDQNSVSAIEKEIVASDLGLSVTNDGKGLRVIFPELTGESRERMVKIIKQKCEDAKISVRKEREEIWSDIQKKEKDGELNEDEKFRYKDEMQKIIDSANDRLDELAEKKEAEIQG